MNRDRGTIKWNAMMLPEHVKLLREWKAEDDYVKMPEIDEWAKQEMAEQLQVAYTTRSYIELTYWRNGEVLKERGIVQSLRPQFIIFDERQVLFTHVIRVMLLDD